MNIPLPVLIRLCLSLACVPCGLILCRLGVRALKGRTRFLRLGARTHFSMGVAWYFASFLVLASLHGHLDLLLAPLALAALPLGFVLFFLWLQPRFCSLVVWGITPLAIRALLRGVLSNHGFRFVELTTGFTPEAAGAVAIDLSRVGPSGLTTVRFSGSPGERPCPRLLAAFDAVLLGTCTPEAAIEGSVLLGVGGGLVSSRILLFHSLLATGPLT